jgi:SAM-dependent methyltransferase
MKPELYHQHHTGYQEDLPYWLTLADDAAGPVLELGCGTGRVFSQLRQEGIPVIGLDNDLRMLEYLKNLDPTAQVFLADLTRFQLGRTFPLILLPCNTYSTLTAAQRRDALACIARHLAPGGTFAASLPNPADLIEMGNSEEADPEEHFLHPGDGAPVQVSSSWQTRDQTVTIYWHYDHLQPDGQVNRTTHLTTHQLDPMDTYLDELIEAGFSVNTLGEFDGTPYHPEADFLILKSRYEGA